jgi:hypothetical protein
MHNNLQTRDAKRIVHELHDKLKHVSPVHLSLVAKALAIKYCVPQKVMLKAMARYVRIHHTN